LQERNRFKGGQFCIMEAGLKVWSGKNVKGPTNGLQKEGKVNGWG